MDVVNQIDDLPIFVKWPLVEMLRSESVSMDDPDAEAAIISTLSGDTYHKLCSEPPLAQLRILPVSNQLPVRLGTIMIFSSNSQYGTLSRIIEPLPIRLGCESSIANLQYHCGRDYHGGDVLANSWIRFGSHQVHTLNLSARVRRSDEACKSWLTQATGIFTQLQITSRLENYVFVRGIQFTLRLLRHTYNTHEPDGYLFVCPPENFRTGPDAFQWPGCPAYWSHDPAGATASAPRRQQSSDFP
ncbi:hypothetical protein B0H14DRAFT_1335823 [Mycena olivaceomarginata]|nr:hypothetical protein B0H14DRAFT_1335823 [Mycena olivaceomarginata]